MHPILFTIGPLTLFTYGAMLALAFLVATGLASRAARQLPSDLQAIAPQHIWDLTSAALLGGIIGGRLFYVGLHLEDFQHSPTEIFAIWRGGLVWYGGFLGGLVAALLYVRTKRLVFLRVCDQLIPFVALGHALGRIGCFLNGCCYGKRGIPTQLLESAGLLLLYVALRQLARRTSLVHQPGRLLGVYLLGYALLRFAIEFLRGDQTPIWMGLTLQQLMSIAIVGVGLTLIVIHRRVPPPRPQQL